MVVGGEGVCGGWVVVVVVVGDSDRGYVVK